MHLAGMNPADPDPRTRRRLVALITAGIVLLLLAGVGMEETNHGGNNVTSSAGYAIQEKFGWLTRLAEESVRSRPNNMEL